MTEKNVKLEHRLTSLETKVETILSNHLPHLKDDILEIKNLLTAHTVEERTTWEGFNKKIENIKLGIPSWMTIIISIFVGLVVYLLTH